MLTDREILKAPVPVAEDVICELGSNPQLTPELMLISLYVVLGKYKPPKRIQIPLVNDTEATEPGEVELINVAVATPPSMVLVEGAEPNVHTK